MLRTFLTTLRQPVNILTLVFLVPVVSIIFFGLSQYAFVLNVLSGQFPSDLYARLLPGLVHEFFFGNGIEYTLHYALSILLLSVYLTLVLHIFWHRRAFSFSSFSVGAFGLLGISLGVSCISCGAIIGTILFSLVGASASSYLLSYEQTTFLLIGELLLLGSIVLIVRAIAKLRI